MNKIRIALLTLASLVVGYAASAETVTTGNDGTSGDYGPAYLDATTSKLWCSQAPGISVQLPAQGSPVSWPACSIVQIMSSDVCTNTAGGCPILDTNGRLPTAQVPPMPFVTPTGMACAGKTDTTTSTATATSTGTLYQTSAQPVTCTVTKATTDIGIGMESPRTIYYPFNPFFGTWPMAPSSNSGTASDSVSVTSSSAVVDQFFASAPNIIQWPAGSYRFSLWAGMASTPASVYFTVTAGSTVIATSPTVTVAVGSVYRQDIVATSASSYFSSAPLTDSLVVKLYASSSSTNNLTIGYGGATPTYVSAPWSGFSAINPLAAGTASPGTSQVPAQSNHVHPAQTHASDDLYATTAVGASGGDYAFAYRTGTDTSTDTSTGTGTSCPLSRNCTLVRTSTTTATATVTNSVNGYAISINPVLNYADVGAIGCGGTCSVGNFAAFNASGTVVNGPMTYSGSNVYVAGFESVTGTIYANGVAVCQQNTGNCPTAAALGGAVPGTCPAGQYASATTTSGVTCSTPAGSGGNVSTAGLTSGKIPVANGSTSLTDSPLAVSGSTVAMNGTFKSDVFQTNDTKVTLNAASGGGVTATGVIQSTGSYVYGTNIDSSGNTTGHAASDCRSDGYNCPSGSTLGAVAKGYSFNVKGVYSSISSSGVSVGTSWTNIASLHFSDTSSSVFDISAVATLQAPSFTGSTPATFCCLRILLDTTQVSMGFNSCGSPVTPSYVPSQPVSVTLPVQATTLATSGAHDIYVQAIETDASGYHGCDSHPYSVSLIVRDYGGLP